MKIFLALLLPLAISGAVIRCPLEASSENAAQAQATHSGCSIDTLSSKRRLPNDSDNLRNIVSRTYGSLSKRASSTSPTLQQIAIDALAWALGWAWQPVKVDRGIGEIDPRAKKSVLRYGPFTLLGQKYNRTALPISINMDDKADVLIRTLKGMPNNAAILSGRMDTVFPDGSKAGVAEGVYIHHLLVADVAKNSAPFAMCFGDSKKKMVTWIASTIVDNIGPGLIQSGNDQVGGPNIYSSSKKDVKSAFLTGPDDTYLLEAEIVNYNPENTTVYLNFEVEYLEEQPVGYLDTSTVLFSATGCASPGYRPPNKDPKYNFTSQPFVMKSDGYIINARGHLHDGGTAIQMILNDKVICESLPTYASGAGAKSPDGKDWQTITDMSRCNDMLPFKKGDIVKLKSIYDTTAHPLREGAHEGGMSHGGGTAHDAMEGMEEMGIFTVNIATINAAETEDSVRKTKKPQRSASRHSTSRHSKTTRSTKYEMVEIPEPLYPISLL